MQDTNYLKNVKLLARKWGTKAPAIEIKITNNGTNYDFTDEQVVIKFRKVANKTVYETLTSPTNITLSAGTILILEREIKSSYPNITDTYYFDVHFVNADKTYITGEFTIIESFYENE